MRVIIPFFGSRVAPNLLYSDQSLIVQIYSSKIVSKKIVSTLSFTETSWLKLLEEYKIQILICGGIDKNFYEELNNRDIEVIKNVAGELDEIVEHLINGKLKQGYGISYKIKNDKYYNADELYMESLINSNHVENQSKILEEKKKSIKIDCISCKDKSCLKGENCQLCPLEAIDGNGDDEIKEMLEVSYDISFEPERVLCRVSELVYFCLGMKYKKIGIAFCIEMWKEVEMVIPILKRFFDITSVCCKIGNSTKNGNNDSFSIKHDGCNPINMANILNLAKTDYNIAIGLCMGCDSIFNKRSEAPVTTLFVKDKLLAHNPVGAVYTKYALEHLEEEF